MAFGLFELFEEVDRRIARALARIGVTGSTIDGGSIGGSLPPGVLPNLAGDVTGAPGANTVVAIQGVEVSATPPTAGQVMTAIDADSAEWQDPASVDLTVREVDGTPTETPTTILEFPNGTLTEPGAGIVRYTPAAVPAAPVDATYIVRTANGTLTNEVLLSAVLASELQTRFEPLTNGDPVTPELVFAAGDCIMVEVPV